MLLLLQMLSFFWAITVAPVALVLLCTAITWSGQTFALAALCLGVSPLLGLFGYALEKPKWRRTAACLLFFSATTYALLFVHSPLAAANPRVQLLINERVSRLSRLTPSRILPEEDQLARGYALMIVLDPLLTIQQAALLRRLTADVYAEMNSDAQFRALPTQLGRLYQNMLLPGTTAENGFVYVPESVARDRRAPVLVFLHGSGGNFKGYFWILSRVAEEIHSVLIAPSFGFGNWRSPDTEATIEAALTQVQSLADLDLSRITILGLSSGGLGVCQAISAAPDQWNSAIMLSPVFDEDALARLNTGNLKNLSILVMSGADDDRVPLAYVRSSSERLRKLGADVRDRSASDQSLHDFQPAPSRLRSPCPLDKNKLTLALRIYHQPSRASKILIPTSGLYRSPFGVAGALDLIGESASGSSRESRLSLG